MNNSPAHDQIEPNRLKHVETQISNGMLREAALELNALVAIQPNDPRLFLLGSLLGQAANNNKGALDAALRAHQLAPTWPVATIRLAEVHGLRGSSDDAIAAATLAVDQSMRLSGLNRDTPEVLLRAIALAQGLGMHKIALKWLYILEKIDLTDYGVQYRIGLALIETEDYAAARAVFDRLVTQYPQDPQLLRGRVRAALGYGDVPSAYIDVQLLLTLEPDNLTNSFYSELVQGKTPTTQPAVMIENLFNTYAGRYDKHLVQGMKYKLPYDVAQTILSWHPDRKADILDLGCGTGLLGACLGSMEGVLVGVDLSNEMVKQAAEHHVYDRFHLVNILDAMQATPGDLYQVIVALEVFIYVGCIDTVISNAYRVLTPGGRLVFSCETSEADNSEAAQGYRLESTFRFTHQILYIERVLQESGFVEVEIRQVCIRVESGKPVAGVLVFAKKPPMVGEKIARKSPKNAKRANHQQ